MFLSKIWFILVALLAAVAITLAVVAPRPAAVKLEKLEGQRLDRAQYAAQQMLRADAHLWIDTAGKLGRDAVIAESLDAASRGAGELAVIHKTVQDRLRALVPDLAKGGLSWVAAVDAKGRVIARIGEGEAEYKEGIGGAEVIADALHGYLSDDTWGAGGRIVRVAAAPVPSKQRDRIVGALATAAETGPRLADIWKKNLGVEVAILLRGRIVASTIPEGMLGPLPELVASRAPEIAEAKRTTSIPVKAGGDLLLVVAAPFQGMAGEQQAYYALVGKQPARADLSSVLSNTTAGDLRWSNFPWLVIGGGFILILAIGLGLQHWEVGGPLGRLRKEVARLARGEQAKVEDRAYSSKLGGIARDVNATLERFTHAPAAPTEMAGKDLNAILGGTASAPPRATASAAKTQSDFDRPSQTLGSLIGPPPPPAFEPPATPYFNPPPASPFGAPPPAAGSARPAPSFAPPPPVSQAPAAPRSAPPRPSPPGPGLSAPAAPPLASALPRLPLPAARSAPAAALPPVPLGADATTEMPIKAPPFEPLPSRPSRQVAATEPVASPPADGEPDQRFAGGSAGSPADPEEAEEAHFRAVFEEYVTTKRECGEPTESLSLDKFRIKLRDNKAALLSKYACRDVRFSVYIKDGKAALKATPIRD